MVSRSGSGATPPSVMALYDDYDRSEKDDHMMMMVIIIMMMIVVMNRWQYQWSSVACTSGLLSKLSSPLVRF